MEILDILALRTSETVAYSFKLKESISIKGCNLFILFVYLFIQNNYAGYLSKIYIGTFKGPCSILYPMFKV